MDGFPIFLSYSRLDIEQVRKIKASIEEATNVRCWVDLNAIESGSPRFTKNITDGINNCSVFLFLLSENSQRSKYALRELSFADSKGKHVVIVNINDCDMIDEFKFLYGLSDTISWNDLPQQEKLLRDLKRWVGEKEGTAQTSINETMGDRTSENKGVSKEPKKKKLLPWVIVGGLAVAVLLILGIKAITSSHASLRSTPSGKLLVIDGVSYLMTPVEGGTFQMGDPEDELSDNSPAHMVSVSSFYIGETEVTQALWKAVMHSDPSTYKGNSFPVENVSWEDCQDFIRKLNHLTGKNFRLPTEAEWEYAARGSNQSKGFLYAGSNNLDEVAWCRNNSADHDLSHDGSSVSNSDSENNNYRPREVRNKLPNELGIYDMSGNVREWCNDAYYDYSNSPESDPFYDGEAGSHRMVRGGTFFHGEFKCRVYSRDTEIQNDKTYNLGVRLCLPK